MAGISPGEDWAAAASELKDRMAKLGMTQFDLASKSGVSIATIREMLHARERQRSPRTLSGSLQGTRLAIWAVRCHPAEPARYS